MGTKRAYKLQEFVAHASDINCLKIGRRLSRILITGGEDQKVNLWAIGKPTPILSLSGLTSPVESVSFDSSEVMVAAGAASGTIKLWDLEEAKVVRTFTGHRSNCTSIDFHPFGEFFASGSSDTNMKIWDMRRKGCIHTYKGHTRRINVLRFTPDGRWVVSGGDDNAIKIWDLTAGKLLNDSKFHEGPINCIDFHPHEFLLATGSVDKTVKFWDLETFELIGSSGPENNREFFVPASVVRSMAFNSDGKTLFCGLHESLKVLSWEPIICHDVVNVGWSTLADLNVHEGKLLGCSYNQSCVGVWVVDLSQIEPYAVRSAGANQPVQAGNNMTAGLGRSSVLRSSGSGSAPGTPQRGLGSASKAVSITTATTVARRSSKSPETTNIQTVTTSDVIYSVSPKAILKQGISAGRRREIVDAVPLAASRTRSKVDLSDIPGAVSGNSLLFTAPRNRSIGGMIADTSKEARVLSVIVPRNSLRMDPGANPGKEDDVKLPVAVAGHRSKGYLATDPGMEAGKLLPKIVPMSSGIDLDAGPRTEPNDTVPIIPESSLRVNLGCDSGRCSGAETERIPPNASQFKPAGLQRKYAINDTDRENISASSGSAESVQSNEVGNWLNISAFEKPTPAGERNIWPVKFSRNGKLGASQMMESSQSYSIEYRKGSPTENCERNRYGPRFERPRRSSLTAGEQTVSASDEDAIADLMEDHEEFLIVGKSRQTKLQVIHQLWQNNDVRGVVNATQSMSDLAVSADIVSVLMGKNDIITLDLCTCLLPLISSLLESRFGRHLGIALEMLLKLVKTFGPIICSTLSAAPPVGVDLHAEQRLERCNLCFLELEKIKNSLPPILRLRGEIGRLAQELNLFLQDISQVPSR